jgi:hypothetical protein
VSGDPRAARGNDHATFDELAVGWALHALEPEDEAVFTRHLPDCARCARTVAETSDVMAALATDLPPAEPSPQLRARLRDAVEHIEQLPAAAPFAAPVDPDDETESRPGDPARPASADRPAQGFPFYEPRRPADGPVVGTPWRRLAPSALLAAAVAAILALGTWAVMLGDDRDRAEATVAQQAQIMDSLLRPGQATIAPVSDADGHSVATIVARNGQIQVLAHGLSVNNPRATTYVVWGIRDDNPVALGTFDVVQPQLDLRTVGSEQTDLDTYSTYGISLENGRKAPPKPEGPVATGQVTS